MIPPFSQLGTLFLFCLALAGTVFTAQTAFGNSELPANRPGLAASNLHYSLSDADPSRIDMVSFTLASAVQASRDLRIRLPGSGASYGCGFDGQVWNCATPNQPLVRDADQLEILTAP
jgi:hypothetical protein